MNISEALLELGKITAMLESGHVARSTETVDADVFLRPSVEEQARQFAESARRFHRTMMSANDCRPSLRLSQEERRQVADAKPYEQQTPEEQGREYATMAREFHRK
jgi:hypothetical protein